jgi:carbon monoxide dehydrogenase subunit G
MAIEIKETFVVAAPIGAVWKFMNNPENVVACMPGASLKEVIDERSFIGAVKLKIGAVSAQYQGTITYLEADEQSHRVKMLAEGNERGGGTVSGTIDTLLVALPDGSGTEVRCSSSVDLTGKIVQVGRGMIEGVSAQIIKKYVANVRALLEVPGQNAAAATPALPAGDTPGMPVPPLPQQTPPPVEAKKEDAINIVAVVLNVLWNKFAGFFRKLLGRP